MQLVVEHSEEARHLIEDLARCNMRPPSKSSGSSSRAKGNGMIELNNMSAMEAKLDALCIGWIKECTLQMRLEQWKEKEE